MELIVEPVFPNTWETLERLFAKQAVLNIQCRGTPSLDWLNPQT